MNSLLANKIKEQFDLYWASIPNTLLSRADSYRAFAAGITAGLALIGIVANDLGQQAKIESHRWDL